MGKITEIRKFASLVAGEHVTISRDREFWGMCLAYSKPHLLLPANPDQNDEEDKAFRKDFVRRCPLARGFANVTISILHELEHHFNRGCPESNEDDYESHFALPEEIIATDWAIEWLQDPEHRKVAKAFERAYFA